MTTEEAIKKAIRNHSEFLGQILRCLPEMPLDVKQRWIENPKDLKRALQTALFPVALQSSRNANKEVKRNMIDCDIQPFTPDSWTIEEHRKGGQMEWDPEKVSLYFTEVQKTGKIVGGHNLRKELACVPVLNACVLDYLLANPRLIPVEWKGKAVFFWGTIYRNSRGDLYVRCLRCYGDEWRWNDRWLGLVWNSNNPAACSQIES